MNSLISSLLPLDTLSSISLTDLQSEAAFLTRRDRKYLVPVADAQALLAEIDESVRVLEIDDRRSFEYLTPYFDDSEHSAYLSAARRRPNRFKVRTRLYTDRGLCLLEVKVRDSRGRTVKHRIEHDAASLLRVTDTEREWLCRFPQVAPYASQIDHCMTTHYHRVTLVLAGGEGRVTLDRDLLFSLPNGETRALPHHLIVETKGPGNPTSVDRLLWRHGYRPVSVSKFTTGLSLLVPHLPANRWHRLRNQFAEASCAELEIALTP